MDFLSISFPPSVITDYFNCGLTVFDGFLRFLLQLMDFLLVKWKSAPGMAREGDGQVRLG